VSLFAEFKRRNVFRVGAAYAVIGWLLIQSSDIVFPRVGLPEWTVTLMIVLVAFGLPLALFLAWAYEITPEGIRRESSADTGAPAPATDPTARRLDALVIVLLLVAAALYLGDRLLSRESSLPSRASVENVNEPLVVVLPFENLGRSDDEYFADGITDEIIQRLVRVEGLRVIARASAMNYKGSGKSLAEIAAELAVDYVLDGTVRWAHLPDGSSRVRISPQLLRMPGSTPLWAEAFEEPLLNVFDIQAAIAERVVDTLGVTVLERDQRAIQAESTGNVDAYQYYLEGRYLLHNRVRLGGIPALERSLMLFDRALELAPEFAVAWAAKASALATLNAITTGSEQYDYDFSDLVARSFAAAERAIALDATLAEPYAARALNYMLQLDWIAAEMQLRMAIEREPRHADTLVRYGILLVTVGRSREALEVLQTASGLDPVNPVTAHWLADALRNTGRLAESKAEAQRSLELGMLSSGTGVYAYHLLQQDWDSAERYLAENMREMNVPPDFVPVLIEAVRNPDQIPAALEILNAIAREHPRLEGLAYSFLYDFADPSPVFDAIDEMIERGDGLYAFWRMWEPQFTHLRNHPRFREIAKRVGFLDYWRQFGWPDQCRPDNDDFSCD
jgi:TolB-like protein/tetratricopeptide (TPR) repeat protein